MGLRERPQDDGDDVAADELRRVPLRAARHDRGQRVKKHNFTTKTDFKQNHLKSCSRYGAGLEGVALPPKELFVRWMQANVFMPAMQFSFVPWQYDQEVRERIETEVHLDKVS